MTSASSHAWRLHLENIELQLQARELRRELRRVHTKTTRCVYCGTKTHRRERACHAHSDLPALDTGYHGRP